jgi:hypothetical protein
MIKEAREEAKKNRVSDTIPSVSPGSLLDIRRKRYNIPDEVFGVSAVYDRILVYQVQKEEKEFYDEGGLIKKTEIRQTAERRTTPSGVIVTAGVQALDILRSNGVDLGHLVFYTQLAFYRIPVDTILGEDINLVVLRAGEIVASIDLAHALATRQARTITRDRELKDGTKITQHFYVDDKGKQWNPVEGFSPDDL